MKRDPKQEADAEGKYQELKVELKRLLDELPEQIVELVEEVYDLDEEPYVALGMDHKKPHLYVSLSDDESLAGYLSWEKFCEWALQGDPEELEYWAPKLEELAKKMREARAEYGDEP